MLACGAAAIVVAAVAQLALPARGGTFFAWLTCVVLPGTIVMLIAVNRREPPMLVLIVGLLYLETVLLALLYAVAMAFAILLPLIAIGIAQPRFGRYGKAALYATAVVAATFGVALVDLGAPTNPLGADQPLLAVTAFGLVAAFALGMTWRAGEQLSEALEAAGSEIEARKRAERVAVETAQALDLLIRSSAVATLVVDADGRLSVWNAAAARLFGRDESEVLGREIPVGLLGESAEAAARLSTRLLSDEPLHGEIVVAHGRDESELLVEVHSAPRLDAQGRPAGTIVQMIDVTQRTALEAQLRQAQKMEAIGHLAGGIAHDINNTLTAVSGFAELIQAESDDPAVRSDAEMIAGAVRRAADLTGRLLAFARRSVLQPQTMVVGRFLASVQPMLQRLLGADVKVAVVDRAPGATVTADPRQLEQALLNLAVNSRDAMPNGGNLTLETLRSEIPSDSGGDPVPAVLLIVADTGHGIPPEIQDRVFEPFFTTKAQGRGTGLGLAMVYGFVAQSGGTVGLRSTPGEGTAVEIRLPEAGAPGPAPKTVTPEAVMGGSESILLVDDEPAVAELARRLLSSLGYTVTLAHDGDEAIRALRSLGEPIDLVLTDVIMPGMTGPKLVREILEIQPDVKILYTSGYTADAIADRGMLPDGVELVQKPYSFAELASRVRKTLDSKPAE